MRAAALVVLLALGCSEARATAVIPVYTGTVPNPAVPSLTYSLSADGAFIDCPLDGESYGGVDVTGTIQTAVIPASGGETTAAIWLDFNADAAKTVNTSVTGSYTLARAVLDEVAVGAQEWFTFHFQMPITRAHRGQRTFTNVTTHQGGGTSNVTGLWADDATPLSVIRVNYSYTDLTTSGFNVNAFLQNVTGGGVSTITCKAMGKN